MILGYMCRVCLIHESETKNWNTFRTISDSVADVHIPSHGIFRAE